MKSVAIIGSFQKYYEDILGLISLFKKHGFTVTSPYQSRITESRWGFVIFDADDKTLSEDEIQTETLRKILNADAVYVYNPPTNETMPGRGYVGKTTCYEIGLLMAKRKPLYYLCYPDDLPVPVSQEQIISPQEFVAKFIADKTAFILPQKSRSKCKSDLKAVFSKPSLLVCGSMTFFDKMKRVQEELREYGIDAVIPEDESDLPDNMSSEEFTVFKRKVSQNYLKKIRDKGTQAVLLLNEEKKGVKNYIGANTLAEAVMAFTWNRKIFLYNDVYLPLADELLAWEAMPIHRDLSVIKAYFDKQTDVMNAKQIDLFGTK